MLEFYAVIWYKAITYFHYFAIKLHKYNPAPKVKKKNVSKWASRLGSIYIHKYISGISAITLKLYNQLDDFYTKFLPGRGKTPELLTNVQELFVFCAAHFDCGKLLYH